MKKIFNIPCPSCGSTRAVIQIFNGKFLSAFYLNPLGYIIFLGLIVLPFWVIIDYLKNKYSLFRSYFLFEKHIQKPLVFIPLGMVIIINWIWNFYKLL